MQRTDVVISGGGMVGLTLGLALAQGGLKTMIVDIAAPARVLAPAFDGRVSALAYASVRMLTALGVWDDLAPQAQRQADHAATTDQDINPPQDNSCLITMQKPDFAQFTGKMTCLFLSH